MSYLLEIFGRSLPDSLWPVFRESLQTPDDPAVQRTTVRQRTLQHVMEGATALKNSSASQAKRHFDRAMSLHHDSPAAIMGMACAVDLLGQPARARDYLQQILEQSPEDARTLYAIGLLEERCNQPAQAREIYQRSIYFHPNQRGSRQRLMALALAEQDYESAVRQAETLAAQFPLELPAWTRLGGLYLLNDDPARALKAFDQALHLLADNWRNDSVIASENYQHETLAEAVDEIRRAMAQDEKCADLHVRLGDIYARHSRHKEALAEYRQALHTNPYYLEATTKVAACYIRLNQAQRAAMWLGRSLQVNETLLMAYVGLALAQAYMGKDKESDDTLDMARGIASNAPVLMAEIARLHMAESLGEDPAAAIDSPRETRQLDRAELLTKAIQAHLAWLTGHQDDASAWMRLGMLLEADKQPESARQAYEKTVEMYAGATPAVVRLGLALKTPDSATSSQLRRAFWPEGIDLGVHYGLSILFSQIQRFEMTAEKFADVLPGSQDDSFWRNLALGLEQMSMLNTPRNLWQSLTEMSNPNPEAQPAAKV